MMCEMMAMAMMAMASVVLIKWCLKLWELEDQLFLRDVLSRPGAYGDVKFLLIVGVWFIVKKKKKKHKKLLLLLLQL